MSSELDATNRPLPRYSISNQPDSSYSGSTFHLDLLPKKILVEELQNLPIERVIAKIFLQEFEFVEKKIQETRLATISVFVEEREKVIHIHFPKFSLAQTHHRENEMLVILRFEKVGDLFKGLPQFKKTYLNIDFFPSNPAEEQPNAYITFVFPILKAGG